MKQILPDDALLCSVYNYLAVINKHARSFHDLELEELRQLHLRDNATLVDSIRNLTNHPDHGLENLLETARRNLLGTPPRGHMCVRTILQILGPLDPVWDDLFIV